MRLYLSSFRVGNRPRRLAELVQDNTHAAVMLNACDLLSEDERQIRLQQEMAALQSLGLRAAELDLCRFFPHEHQHHELHAVVASSGLL